MREWLENLGLMKRKRSYLSLPVVDENMRLLKWESYLWALPVVDENLPWFHEQNIAAFFHASSDILAIPGFYTIQQRLEVLAGWLESQTGFSYAEILDDPVRNIGQKLYDALGLSGWKFDFMIRTDAGPIKGKIALGMDFEAILQSILRKVQNCGLQTMAEEIRQWPNLVAGQIMLHEIYHAIDDSPCVDYQKNPYGALQHEMRADGASILHLLVHVKSDAECREFLRFVEAQREISYVIGEGTHNTWRIWQYIYEHHAEILSEMKDQSPLAIMKKTQELVEKVKPTVGEFAAEEAGSKLFWGRFYNKDLLDPGRHIWAHTHPVAVARYQKLVEIYHKYNRDALPQAVYRLPLVMPPSTPEKINQKLHVQPNNND